MYCTSLDIISDPLHMFIQRDPRFSGLAPLRLQLQMPRLFNRVRFFGIIVAS